MHHVMIASPDYADTPTETGYFAHSLAKLYQSLGVGVEIITLHHGGDSPSYQPGPGLSRVHRLNTRTSHRDVSFAPQALGRILERANAKHFDALFVIDSPALELLCLSTNWSSSMPTVTPIPTSSFCTYHPKSALPTVDGVFSPPSYEHPTIAVFDPTNKLENKVLVEAFRDSNAPSRGWSLGGVDRTLGWSVIDAQESTLGPDLIVATIGETISISPYLFGAHGATHIHATDLTELTHQINQACDMDRDDRRQAAIDLWSEQLTPEHKDARASFWMDFVGSSTRDPSTYGGIQWALRWKQLEKYTATIMPEVACHA